MSFSVNKLTLVGNLGKDAETRFTTSNVGVTNFSLATTHSYKGKDENWVDETTWHYVTAFNLSDFMKDNLKKGKKFYVEGRLSKREYEDKEGNTKLSVECIAEKMIPLDGNNQGSSNTASSQGPQDPDDDLPF